MRLLIAGGGTGGHLFPALAIARAVMALEPDSSILFVGTRHGIEARIIPGTEFPISFVTARGMRSTGILNTARGALELPLAIVQSWSIIRAFKPTTVVGVGGYASGPTLAAAVMMRIPTAIQEQNSVMGTTNRLLARYVHRIFISWEDTEPRTSPQKTVLTGNPVRQDVMEGAVPARNDDRVHLLIFGGSRGARSINQAFAMHLDQLAPMAQGIRILHQTGAGAAEEMREQYRAAGIDAEVTEFIDRMGPAYQWADLVVSRSGASSLAEITALGKPAVVIPYPYAIGDHQAKNAAALESRGAVRVIRDDELKNGRLLHTIRGLVQQPDSLRSMAQNSKRLGRPQAAFTVAHELRKIQRSPS
jgi:UDP-N-acetylglucosamine--N-acetylmuramyl-(pentapeptide) pyrophosphoryl-undecaprenol N-acetylglucosamine transferase